MKTFARIVGGQTVDVTTTDNINALFHPDIVVQFIEVPDGTLNGATYDADAKQWVNPTPGPMTPAAVQYPVLTPPQFRMLFTSPERIALRANIASATPDPVLSDFFTELNDPQLREVDLNLASVQGAIAHSISYVAPLMNPRYTTNDVARRIAEMMVGVPQ